MRDAVPRRRSFPLALAFLAALCAPAASAAVIWNKVYSGFSSPLEITHAHDGSQRLFVVEQSGKIRIIKGGAVLAAPFIDLGPAGLDVIAASGERGLLGIAFHPQYATNRQFYVNYTRKSDGATVIARYLASAGNADVADPASGTILLTIAQPEANHNGGAVKFGPDGFLYIGMGDGGGGNDQHGTIGNGQDKSTLLGKILRIDVDSGGANPYAIPPGNPYASGVGGRSEIFAIGVRNPWRMSFDRATGDFWFGDVGQGAVEEVDMLPAGTGAGTNFGWRIMEGTSCTGLASPPIPCNDASLKLPVVEYTHALGCSVTGGYVYRGTAVPALVGQYLYGDFCSGRIWAAQRVGAGPWTTAQLGATGYAISTFGEDEAGELYFANHATGDIYQFADSAANTPILVTAAGPLAFGKRRAGKFERRAGVQHHQRRRRHAEHHVADFRRAQPCGVSARRHMCGRFVADGIAKLHRELRIHAGAGGRAQRGPDDRHERRQPNDQPEGHRRRDSTPTAIRRRRRDRVLPRGSRSLLHDAVARGNRGAGRRPVQRLGEDARVVQGLVDAAGRDAASVPLLHPAERGRFALLLGQPDGMRLGTGPVPELRPRVPGVMHEALPDAVSGACPVNTTPIYRVWNKRPDSNHRYLTNRAMRDAMVARGYVAEGYGPDAVAMCGP